MNCSSGEGCDAVGSVLIAGAVCRSGVGGASFASSSATSTGSTVAAFFGIEVVAKTRATGLSCVFFFLGMATRQAGNRSGVTRVLECTARQSLAAMMKTSRWEKFDLIVGKSAVRAESTCDKDTSQSGGAEFPRRVVFSARHLGSRHDSSPKHQPRVFGTHLTGGQHFYDYRSQRTANIKNVPRSDDPVVSWTTSGQFGDHLSFLKGEERDCNRKLVLPRSVRPLNEVSSQPPSGPAAK